MLKKILMGAGALFLVIIVFAAVGGGGTHPEKVGETTVESQKATNPQPTDETQPEYKVGDKVQLGKAIVAVNDVEYSQGGEYGGPSEGNEWVDLNITIENTDSSEQFVTTLGQMFIRDGEANSYQVAVTGKTIESPAFGLDGTILAKSKRTGWVGFEIKKGATGLKFVYKGSMWGGGTITVDLGR